MLVRSESNSRPPAWQPDAQPTEPPVRGETLSRTQTFHNLAAERKQTYVSQFSHLTSFQCCSSNMFSCNGRRERKGACVLHCFRNNLSSFCHLSSETFLLLSTSLAAQKFVSVTMIRQERSLFSLAIICTNDL